MRAVGNFVVTVDFQPLDIPYDTGRAKNKGTGTGQVCCGNVLEKK